MTTKITINGHTIMGNNKSVINMRNGKIMVDGKDHTPTDKIINILVHGDVDVIDMPGANEVVVAGSCREVRTTSGDVEIGGDVGSITATSGDIKVDGNVEGSLTTMSGDIRCGDVRGNLKTMSGDIIKRK
jgi:hypothetical protein